MSTLVTPSAKSHERVTGRWLRDIQADSRREWFLYYAKSIIGTPIPWLFAAYAALCFISRAGLELAAWACSFLTLLYIITDRLSANRELRFFRVGSDLFLLGYALVTVACATLIGESFSDSLATLGGIRWILLLYLITYCWELFPGLNRMYFLIIAVASICAGYGAWQHFSGLDLVRGTALGYAPAPGHAYFTAVGFFSSPEVFGTLLATLLPLPTAAFLLNEERERFGPKWIAATVVVLLSVALFWTYRPGLWMAGGVGIAVTMLLKGKNKFALLGTLFISFCLLIAIVYGSPSEMLKGVQANESARAERQRAQINTQVKLWQENTWIGVGRRAVAANDYDPGTGNVYFQILAQSGVLGLAFYFLFVLTFLLSSYTIFSEIPRSHYWHRVLVSGAIAGQIAFHLAGLYWSTLAEAFAVNFFILLISSISYLSEHYSRGLVPDDRSL